MLPDVPKASTCAHARADSGKTGGCLDCICQGAILCSVSPSHERSTGLITIATNVCLPVDALSCLWGVYRCLLSVGGLNPGPPRNRPS